MGQVNVQAVLFDYSGTLFRLEEDDSWFHGIEVDERQIDGHVQAELMRRMTAPTGQHVDMTPEAHHAWVNRDLAAAPAPRGLPARPSRVRGGRPPRRSAVRPDDRPAELDAVPRHRRGAGGPAPAGHQDRGGLQHRVRRAAGVRVDRRGRIRRRIRAVLRGRRHQARRGDLRDRVEPAGGGGRARGHGRRQRRGRRRRPRPRLRIRPGRSAADDAASRRPAQGHLPITVCSV